VFAQTHVPHSHSNPNPLQRGLRATRPPAKEYNTTTGSRSTAAISSHPLGSTKLLDLRQPEDTPARTQLRGNKTRHIRSHHAEPF
jgi:hypothetical protein